jgi:hypothetical protein
MTNPAMRGPRRARPGARTVLLGATIGTTFGIASTFLFTSPAWSDAKSDARATYVPAHVSSCADLSLPNDTFLGDSTHNASDATLSGELYTPWQGQELDVYWQPGANQNIVVDAVVVSGSANSYNDYTNSKDLVPAQHGPNDNQGSAGQHYIAPLTSANGYIPPVTQWFVCYHPSAVAATPAGSIGLLGATGLSGVGLGGFAWFTRRRRTAKRGGSFSSGPSADA